MEHWGRTERTTSARMIEVLGVSRSYGDVKALSDVSLPVAPGERVVVCGPHGSGKSTLLRCIGGIEPCQQGKVLVGGVDISELSAQAREVRLGIGTVFQSFNLFPHMSVLQNCTVGLREARKMTRQAAQEKAGACLARVRCADLRDLFPSDLSDGQKQRVAIARALCMDPNILLLDEPTRKFKRSRGLRSKPSTRSGGFRRWPSVQREAPRRLPQLSSSRARPPVKSHRASTPPSSQRYRSRRCLPRLPAWCRRQPMRPARACARLIRLTGNLRYS